MSKKEKDIQTILDRASGLRALGFFNEAMAEYEKLFTMDYSQEDIFSEISSCLFETNFPSKVVKKIEKLCRARNIERNLEARVMFLLGLEMEERGYDEQAYEVYGSALKLDPKNDRINDRLYSITVRYSSKSPFDYLVKNNVVSVDQLLQALTISKNTKESLGYTLIDQFKIRKEAIGESLSDFYGCPFRIYDPDIPAPFELLKGLKFRYLQYNYFAPLKKENGTVTLVIDNPHDFKKIDDIKMIFGFKLKFNVALREDILSFISHFEDELNQLQSSNRSKEGTEEEKTEETKTHETESDDEFLDLDLDLDIKLDSEESLETTELKATVRKADAEYELSTEEESIEQADELLCQLACDEEEENDEEEDFSETAKKLIDHILTSACREDRSDIHIDQCPLSKKTEIRFLKDGTHKEQYTIPGSITKAFLDRLKIMAEIDFSEKRLPQDGKIEFKPKDMSSFFEVRLATLPTEGGYENAVLKIVPGGETKETTNQIPSTYPDSSPIIGQGTTRAAVNIMNEENSEILTSFPEDMALPAAATCSLMIKQKASQQQLIVFEGTRKIGTVPLPDLKNTSDETAEIKLTSKLQKKYLEIELENFQSKWTQKHRLSLSVWDTINCSVFSPPEIPMGEMFLIQAFIHLPAQKMEAEAMAREFDSEAKRKGSRTLNSRIARGSLLTFHLVMPGLEIDDEIQETVWWGEPTSVQFGASVPDDLDIRYSIGTITVSQDRVPIGQVKFKVKIIKNGQVERRAPESIGEALPFDLFFISYSSEDRNEVIKRLQVLQMMGKRFYQDLINLDPGERWERKLYHFIDQCDAVLLFWSANAKKSKWVMQECRYAIDKKGLERVIPVIIEGPPPVEPPPELAELHMNDRMLYFMQ